MRKICFTTQEEATQFIEDVNQLGYEWHPVHLYYGKSWVKGCNWILEFEASKRVTAMLLAYMHG